MAKEQHAKIARKNGVKSKGPINQEGKANVSAYAVRTGNFIKKLAHFIPLTKPSSAAETGPSITGSSKNSSKSSGPSTKLALAAVPHIAIARWQIKRLHVRTRAASRF